MRKYQLESCGCRRLPVDIVNPNLFEIKSFLEELHSAVNFQVLEDEKCVYSISYDLGRLSVYDIINRILIQSRYRETPVGSFIINGRVCEHSWVLDKILAECEDESVYFGVVTAFGCVETYHIKNYSKDNDVVKRFFKLVSNLQADSANAISAFKDDLISFSDVDVENLHSAGFIIVTDEDAYPICCCILPGDSRKSLRNEALEIAQQHELHSIKIISPFIQEC